MVLEAAAETAAAMRRSNASLGRDSETYLAVEHSKDEAKGVMLTEVSTEEALISSSEASRDRAKTSASPGSDGDSAATAPVSTGRSSDSFEAMALFGPEQSSSKMSPASYPLARVVDAASAESFYDGISDEALTELRAATGSVGPAKQPGRSGSGTQEPTSPWSAPRWRTSGTASATEYSTADTSESPRDGAASSSSLSSILEPTVDPRYYLSPRAALGILSRAGRRGRELPSHLLAALEAVVREDEALWAEYEGSASGDATT